MLEVVEREHRIKQHEPRLIIAVAGRLGKSVPRTLQRRLEPARRVVAEIADGAAGEPWQTWNERRMEISHEPAYGAHERLAVFGDRPTPLEHSLAVPRAHHEEGILAKKRIPRDLLAAFHAFQQERVVGVLRNLEERGDRRQQIRHDLLTHGHEGAALCQLDELRI